MNTTPEARNVDGGSHAARGLRCQYLHTVREVLNLVTGQQHRAASLEVEGLSPTVTSTDQQVVDYSVLDSSGHPLRLVQVKSVADRSKTMGIGGVVEVVERLVEHDASTSALITNARGSRHARDLATALSESASGDDLRARLLVMARSQPAVCESDPAGITVENLVENTAPRLILLRMDGWSLLLDEE